MARVTDFLYRFRPAGSPGAASAAGVPVDRGSDLAAELDPLFERLVVTEHECDRVLGRARAEASVRRGRDAESARAIAGSARDRTAVERAAAASAVQRAGESELSAIRATALSEAEALRIRATARIPAYVAQVVTVVRAVADVPSGGEGRGAA